jgi:hypothetical protein
MRSEDAAESSVMVQQMMSNFFILEQGKVVNINPKVLLIPEFQRLWIQDKSHNKAKALREFAFIYFMADFQSEYNAYGLDKEEQIADDIFGDPKYRPNDSMMEAIGKYEKLQQTHSLRMLKAIQSQADRLIRHNELEAMKDTDYDPRKAMASMKGFEDVMEQLEKWTKKVAGEEDEMIIRGGGKVGLFEDSENATYLSR